MIKEQLNPDWLDALSILRRAIDSHDIRAIFERFFPRPVTNLTPVHLVDIMNAEAREDGELRTPLEIHTSPSFTTLPKIERVEILTYAACGAWFWITYPGDPFVIPREAFQQLCLHAGCWYKNNPDIRERWRLIDFYRPAAELPNACFENRLKCTVCSQPVATGAGAYVLNKDEIGTGRTSSVYKPGIHEECMRYVHRVLVPQVKALREATQGSTVEVDK